MTLEELEERVKAFESVEKRLKVLEDIEEIKQLHINYILALSEQNFEAMIECFTEDAIFEMVGTHKEVGKDEIAKMLREMGERQREKKMWKGGQILVHPVISVDGDTAKGVLTYFRITIPHKFVSALGQEVTMLAPDEAGYDMEYRRVDGKWKMSVLKLTWPWPADQWREVDLETYQERKAAGYG